MTESQISKFIESFTSYLQINFSRQAVTEDYDRNELMDIRRLDSLARVLNGSDAQNCTAVCLYKGKLYIASNKDIFDRIRTWIQQIKLYTNARKLPRKNNTKRPAKDLRKVVASLSGVGRRKICKRTKGGSKSSTYIYKDVQVMASLVNVFNDIIANIILIPNVSGLHAELCVMSYLISNQLYDIVEDDNILFGISKLCCKLCACGMKAVGLLARKHYRAIHGNFYNKWVMPSFIADNKHLVKEFLGQEAYAIYKSRKNIRPTLLALIPTQLNIESVRGGSPSGFSDSEADCNSE